MLGRWYTNFHSDRLCPEMQSKVIYTCSCYELCDLLPRANAICFKQETGTLQDNTVYSLNQRGIHAVWLYIKLYNCILVQLPKENQTL